ncbi:putative CAP [Hibiscus syriacus]|uniref:CAP n=1 Tax=Hibiscus syriacus TaxID=106335 RepID=A0A6A2XEJ0_HIBSY|nr:putative CAP [Hibiscus syriacus]
MMEEDAEVKWGNWIGYVLLPFTIALRENPLDYAAGALSHKVVSRTTMCFSNMVGPLEEIGFYGHPMAFLATSSYGQPYALMINFQSYVDKMTIVLSVDEGTIPDPGLLCDDIVESLRLIKESAVTGGLP